jgi:hypothetical protein
VFLQHLGQPLQVRGQEKVLQVHEGLNGARSSTSRMECPAVIVEGKSELFWLHNSLVPAIFCWTCSAHLHALASTSLGRGEKTSKGTWREVVGWLALPLYCYIIWMLLCIVFYLLLKAAPGCGDLVAAS